MQGQVHKSPSSTETPCKAGCRNQSPHSSTLEGTPWSPEPAPGALLLQASLSGHHNADWHRSQQMAQLASIFSKGERVPESQPPIETTQSSGGSPATNHGSACPFHLTLPPPTLDSTAPPGLPCELPTCSPCSVPAPLTGFRSAARWTF